MEPPIGSLQKSNSKNQVTGKNGEREFNEKKNKRPKRN